MTLEKELAHGDKHNFVPVLAHALSISLADAIDELAARAGREVLNVMVETTNVEACSDN
jgi:hypothetical protein